MTAHLDLGSVRLKAPTFFLIQRPLVLAGSLTDTLPYLSALRPGYKADRTSRFPVIRIILQDTTEPPLRRLKKRAQLPAYQSFHPPARNLQESVLKMPLVVPQATTNDWEEKLLGKKIGDSHDNVVCPPDGISLPRFQPLLFEPCTVSALENFPGPPSTIFP